MAGRLRHSVEPTDWNAIIFSAAAWVRFPHMLVAAYVTTAFCVAATGAWHLLKGKFNAEASRMLRMGLGLAAVLVPIQIGVGVIKSTTGNLRNSRLSKDAEMTSSRPRSRSLLGSMRARSAISSRSACPIWEV